MNSYTSSGGPTLLCPWNLNYYMLQPATIRQQQPTRSKGPWTGGILDSGPWRGGVLDNGPWTGGVLDNGPYIDLFPTSNEVWVTDVIFSNGVVPWEIPIYFFSLTTISQILIKIAVLGYKHFMLENRNIGVNMGTEALVAG